MMIVLLLAEVAVVAAGWKLPTKMRLLLHDVVETSVALEKIELDLVVFDEDLSVDFHHAARCETEKRLAELIEPPGFDI